MVLTPEQLIISVLCCLSELFLSLEGNELERLMNEIAESCDVNDNDVNLLNTEDFNVDQFIGAVFYISCLFLCMLKFI